MQNPHAIAPEALGGNAFVRQQTRERPAPWRLGRDQEFVGMLRSFNRGGGLICGHEMTSLLANQAALTIGTFARRVVEGEVVHFDWQRETWFPMFQFGGPDMLPSPGVSRVLKELHRILDPWDTALWFASPHDALNRRTPAEAIAHDPDWVLQAARCDGDVPGGGVSL